MPVAVIPGKGVVCSITARKFNIQTIDQGNPCSSTLNIILAVD
jgi:hypothetical protein